jgi:hypothetical protein
VLGDATFTAAWAEGAALSPEATMAKALDEGGDPADAIDAV